MRFTSVGACFQKLDMLRILNFAIQSFLTTIKPEKPPIKHSRFTKSIFHSDMHLCYSIKLSYIIKA